MARNWTNEQLNAINTRNKSLLVSAAAGSGKTATLTQRIIESVLDEQSPIDIDRMLVVTFTKAAVGELRERISDAIKTKLAECPSNSRLEKQLYLLPGAKIMTIDAFCNDCLLSSPEAAGINPGYRIADEAEIMIAAREIFDGLTESIMRGEIENVTPEEFDSLTDCLVDTKKMADVFDIFRKTYTRLRSTKEGLDSLGEMTNAYDPSHFTVPDNTVFGKYIVNTERKNLEYRAELFKKLSALLSSEGDCEAAKYAETALSDAEVYTRVAKSDSYGQMKEALEAIKFVTIPTVKAENKTPLMNLFKSVRDKEKEKVKDEASRFFSYTSEGWRFAFEKIHGLLKTFYKVITLFDQALYDYKKRLGIFDYTDIERLTYSMLVKNGEPTEFAKGIREDFLAVYIDEYQDVNDLQDSIFKAITKPDNKFAVGDIKQSIYGFRYANPEIFAAAKREYPAFEKSEDECAASIFLSANFRSSKGVIDFVNAVFDKAFGAFASSIDYQPEDRLAVGREPLGPSFTDKPEIFICKQAQIGYSEESDEIEDSEEGEPVLPSVVAAKIREILDTGRREDGSAVKASDIAVILRSMKGRSEKYVQALQKAGIPTKTSGKKDFFMNSDVLLALCLFNTINNPLRDVYLTGLLRSPIFEFTADELVRIRSEVKGGPFYRALCAYVEKNPDFEKGVHFLKTLASWRDIAEGMRTDRLIRKLFRETGLLALAQKHGEKNNLVRLYEYARSFEGSSFGGLGSFITYINNVIRDGEKIDCNVDGTDEDAVTVISAHSSKGLEYPIVFLADAHRLIRCQDTKDKLLVLPGFGAALRHRTPLGLALVENPMMEAVSEKMKSNNLEEELRILYVALTRARERLYIVGTFSEDDEREYLDKVYVHSLVPSEASYKRLTSHLDIILSSTGFSPTRAEEFLSVGKNASEVIPGTKDTLQNLNTPPTLSEKNPSLQSEETKNTSELTRTLAERFAYKYGAEALTKLPKKMSVSALFPAVLDGTEAETQAFCEDTEEKRTVPEFISGKKATESKRRGIATHLFMQFFDIEKLEKLGAKGELERLRKAQFLSDTEAERVRIDEIEAFCHSKLMEKMKSAKRLYREFRFNSSLPAEIFSEDDSLRTQISGKKILVQGVIDCIIENSDGSLEIVDYKTDRLTKAELEIPSLAEERLRRAHSSQLGYYALAVKEIFGKEPVRLSVYSLHLGRCVDIK